MHKVESSTASHSKVAPCVSQPCNIQLLSVQYLTCCRLPWCLVTVWLQM
jgi:hypothetical protein